jgi:arginyl-tRNA synthetase
MNEHREQNVSSADPVAMLEAELSEVAGVPVPLERPADATHGDYATTVAMRLAGERRVAPREIAAELAGSMRDVPGVASVEIAGPGFLNVTLTDAWLCGALTEILRSGPRFGTRPVVAERIQVEMVSANPTGPITVASARNGSYGDALARLLAFAGHDVDREYYYNDLGAQMDRFRASVEAVRRGEPVPEDGYHGAYLDELAAIDGDPVPAMLERIEATLERFRIHFDGFARQSVLEQRLPEILPRLPTYEQDGALFVRSSDFGDEKDRVLVRSADRGGLPTYEAADIAYLIDKLERGYDRAIYILGADHHGVKGWFAAVAAMLGLDPGRVEVLLYQLVHLTRGGEGVKMSKRRGDVVFLDEFMDEIGVDAARWYLISRGHDQTIDIDVDLAAERSQKNPVYYVQYAHARIAGILGNVGGATLDATELPASGLEVEERELVKRLLEFPDVVAEAIERRGPHGIPTYAIRGADDFHRFYHHHKVLGTEQEAFRLALCRATKGVVARCLDLIGVEAPERM